MIIVVLALVGGVLGGGVLGASGFWTGAGFGALIGWIIRLSNRIEALERLSQVEPRAAARAEPVRPPREEARAAPPPTVERAAATETPRPEPQAVRPAPAPPPPAGAVPAPAKEAAGAEARREHLEPSLFDVGLQYVKRWFTTGNVPVKVGVVLSVFGVGFLVKEGIDRNWLVVPLEYRLILVALFGIALLAIGWRLRRSHRSYALSVQGGGIAVLYLTTYAAFALYGLLPGVLAFGLLVVITAAAGALAVLQDTRALAVLGIVGGFMAPVLTSSGSGDHVALFSYYAILNFAIVGIAWFKAWRELNVLGFLFTFGIGSLWGYNAYQPDKFASTEPFLVLFVVLYTLIPVLFASRQNPDLRGFVDGTLVFGTPIVGFGLQSQLVADIEYGLALSAVALAGFYIGVATYLYRRRVPDLRVLVESLLALSIAFVTVAVPLALDARWTSAAWAMQGAAMIWLGFRQRRKLALAAGVALQVLSGLAYATQSPPLGDELPLVNGYFLGGALLAFAGWFSSRSFDRDNELPGAIKLLASVAALVWASGWWFYAGFAEIDRHVVESFELGAELLFTVATTIAAMLASGAFEWPRLNWLGLALWPIAAFGLVTALFTQSHVLAGLGWVAWPAVVATFFIFLRMREGRFEVLRSALHAGAYWIIAVVLGAETHWQVDRFANGIWPFAAALTVVAAFVHATFRARERLAWPLGAHAQTYVTIACAVVIGVLMLFTLAANLVSPGVAAPLRYVPLLNPLELATAFVFLVVLRWWKALADYRRIEPDPRRLAAVGAALGLFWLTMAVARAVHHWAGVPFDLESLADSSVLQTALSIVWGVTGLSAMVVGARSKHRAVWLGGAALMAVVVVKLFLVELDNTGTLGRIVSFLGVGVLLLVVGYFAPVPPRAEIDKQAA